MSTETNRPHERGFSLIELMITVAVMAIIAAIAYPSYMSHVMKSHRSTGQSKLLEIMQAQERYFTTNSSYADDLTALGYSSEDAVPADGDWYTVGAAACASSTISQCVALTATAQNSQTNDTTCGNLTLSSRGQKGETGTADDAKECW